MFFPFYYCIIKLICVPSCFTPSFTLKEINPEVLLISSSGININFYGVPTLTDASKFKSNEPTLTIPSLTIFEKLVISFPVSNITFSN